MDPPEQALVEVGAAALAAPSAAVAVRVAGSIAANTKRTYAVALKRLDAAIAGQDLTDASLALYLARLHAAGLWPAFVGKAKARARSTAVRFSEAAIAAAVAVTGDAGPLCTGPVGSTGRRRSRPLRSRIKPGSTSSTITSLIGGGGVVVTLTSL